MTKNKIWKLILSVVIALGLWVFVVTTVSPGSTKEYKNVPVDQNNLTGLREDLIITEFKSTVNIKLEGNRSDLNQLDSGSIVIEADLSGIQTADTHKIDYTVRTKGNFASNAFVVKESAPERLTVKVERKKTKQIPVVVQTINETPEGFDYEENEIVVENSHIMISGPESSINRIFYAKIEVDLQEADATIEQNFAYTLCDSERNPVKDINLELIQADVEEVKVTIPINFQTELPLGVNLIEGGGIWEENCKVSFSPIDQLNVWGTPEAFETLENWNLGDIKLADIPMDASYWEQTFRLDVNQYENIKMVKGSELPEMITVRIDFENLETRTMEIPASQFTIEGNEGMDAKIITDALSIELRGDRTQLEQLKPTDVFVIVNVSGKNEGVGSVVAKVVLKEDITKVVVMGKYQVSVDLAKKS